MRYCLVLVVAAASACYSGGDPLVGHATSLQGDGPRLKWDVFAKPLPEIPFPIDVATRPDRSSPTGRRMNASLEAETSFEEDLRAKMARLDGFGTSAPMWLSFESPDPARPELARLDLQRIAEVQRGDGALADDAVLLIDVTPGSPTYGEAMPLDFGNGSFPPTLEDTDEYFPDDPRSLGTNLLFDTYDEDLDGDGHFDHWEDLNQNGALDPGEDRDGDGHLDPEEDTDGDGFFDAPNTWGTYLGDPSRHDGYRDLISFYELATDTLMFRPVAPLAERTTYAVVLTRRLVGRNGEPVQSPFPYVHHLQQKEALRPLFEGGLLGRYGLGRDDVAFAWTFTTQSITGDLVALREGLYGIGPFSHLSKAYPAEVGAVVPVRDGEGPHTYVLPGEKLASALEAVFSSIGAGDFGGDDISGLLDTYGAVDYLVAGDYTSPDFLDAGGGSFVIDSTTGEGPHQPVSLRFLMVVPKRNGAQGPIPVALYCHGYTSLKLEGIVFAGVLAKFGIATFVIDAYGHGLPIGPEFDVIVTRFLSALEDEGVLAFFEALRKDRARDLNNDTLPDPAGDFWSNDLFHTRDNVRQTVLDYMQALRVLRGFDGQRTWSFDLNGDGKANDVAGDFNGDGQVDVGGPDADYFAMGTSMGGILSALLAGIEPRVVAAAPLSPGGGLFEIGLRTGLGSVQRAVFLPMLGPMVNAEPLASEPRIVKLQWLVPDVFSLAKVPFARVGELQGGEVVNELRPGDRVRIENLRSGATDEVVVNAERRFRAHLAADRGDPVIVTVTRPDGTLVKRIDSFEYEVPGFQGYRWDIGEPLVTVQEGLGLRRATPALRRLLGIAQTVLEPGDPVNYATRYHDPVVVRPDPVVPKNVLFTITMGDETVPAATGIALARAAGVIGYRDIDERYGMTQNQLLIEHHVIDGIDEPRYFADDYCRYDPRAVNFDIDDLSNGQHPADLPRLGKISRPPQCSDPSPPAECATPCQVLPPLRATVQRAHGYTAARIPALAPTGQHVIDLPNPALAFDTSMLALNQMGLFLSSRGRILSDHPCLAKNDCSTCAGEPDCPPLPPAPSLE